MRISKDYQNYTAKEIETQGIFRARGNDASGNLALNLPLSEIGQVAKKMSEIASEIFAKEAIPRGFKNHTESFQNFRVAIPVRRSPQQNELSG